MKKRGIEKAILKTVTAFAILASSTASAEEHDLFAEYVRALNTRVAVTQVMRTQAQQLPGWCANMSFVPTDLEVIVPAEFSESGMLHKGVWKDSWGSRGCDADRTYNVMTIIKNAGIVDRQPMLPGTSRADIQLQHDTIPQAIAATAVPTKHMTIACSSNIITDTAYIGPEASVVMGTGNLRPWREDWLVAGCGKMHLVAIHFIPNVNGGFAVNIDPAEIRTK